MLKSNKVEVGILIDENLNWKGISLTFPSKVSKAIGIIQ